MYKLCVLLRWESVLCVCMHNGIISTTHKKEKEKSPLNSFRPSPFFTALDVARRVASTDTFGRTEKCLDSFSFFFLFLFFCLTFWSVVSNEQERKPKSAGGRRWPSASFVCLFIQDGQHGRTFSFLNKIKTENSLCVGKRI